MPLSPDVTAAPARAEQDRPARVVAVIPARGGSKGIPGKNLSVVGGRSLVARAVAAVAAVPAVQRVFVSTDDPAIAGEARAAGAGIVERPPSLADDTASSESALLHALALLRADAVPVDVLVFVQASSPFIDTNALAAAIDRVANGEEDVVFSAVSSHAFLWTVDSSGAVGLNHDGSFRPRRQDMEPQFRETGAFYVLDAQGFEAVGLRFFGRVGLELTDELHALEIDGPAELALARAVASAVDESAPPIRTPQQKGAP